MRGSPAILASSYEGDSDAPQWFPFELEDMNARFRERMMAAIHSGVEKCVAAVSTHAGTKRPVAGYRRSE